MQAWFQLFKWWNTDSRHEYAVCVVLWTLLECTYNLELQYLTSDKTQKNEYAVVAAAGRGVTHGTNFSTTKKVKYLT